MVDIVQLKENGDPQYIKTHVKAIDGLLDYIYPIGRIIETVDPADPSELYGGTWERLKGKVLVGVDEDDSAFSAVSSTGGEKTHTLTVEEIPSHTHAYDTNSINNLVQIAPNSQSVYGRTGNRTANTVATGGGKPHNNMPPYITVYIWKRIA